jgi:hypothetical protein
LPQPFIALGLNYRSPVDFVGEAVPSLCGGCYTQEASLSDEHFTADGSEIKAWAGHEWLRPKNASTNTAGRSENDQFSAARAPHTRQSATDLDIAALHEGGPTWVTPGCPAHLLANNWHAFLIDTALSGP